MYDEIKTTVWPNIELEQGIPLDLEKRFISRSYS
jgi:hypothetical protein